MSIPVQNSRIPAALLLVTLIVSQMIGVAYCDIPTIAYDTHNSWIWENCEEKLKDYSSFAKTASGSQLAKITKLFNCATTYISTDYRSKCESGKSISDFDATVQSYYKGCILPYVDTNTKTCELKSLCMEEYDKCTECLSLSVCASYKKAGSSQKTSYDAATSSRCFSASQNCNISTLGAIAYASCQDYYIQKCRQAWLDANPKDVCNISCSRMVNANILQLSLLLLLAATAILF